MKIWLRVVKKIKNPKTDSSVIVNLILAMAACSFGRL
jgi:hypothetical protein